jgi:hypothetical protein
VTEAMHMFSAARMIGPWAGYLRKGFDLFLAGKDASGDQMSWLYVKSLICYLHAAELGNHIVILSLYFMTY